MKNIILYLSIIILLFSCSEESISLFTLYDEEFTVEMSDSLIINVDKAGGQIELIGELDMIEGQCEILFQTPNLDSIFNYDTIDVIDKIVGNDTTYLDSIFISDTIFIYDILFHEIYEAPIEVSINENFDRIEGDWFFKYEIISIDKVDPSGSFDFSVKYEN